MVVQMSCINQSVSWCILHNFVFEGRYPTPLLGHGNTFPLMFGRLLVQATQQPCKMMEEMRLR